jgi:hypothetical protein
MLQQVLQALETAEGPLSLDELSRRLGIERGALEGMIAFWVHKGRLAENAMDGCGAGSCSHCASRGAGCVFDQAGPRIISLVPRRGGERA